MDSASNNSCTPPSRVGDARCSVPGSVPRRKSGLSRPALGAARRSAISAHPSPRAAAGGDGARGGTRRPVRTGAAASADQLGVYEGLIMASAPGTASRCTGRSFWEAVLPREVGRGPARDLVFHLQAPLLLAQRRARFALVARQALARAVVGVGLGQPVAQARLGDPRSLAISRVGWFRSRANSTAR